ncbi:hypothetical protein [Butyrivibrio sp. AC2005]|uniref:hypothetical protein n=1 Tax=Butyrivibrio sp. AC2005 TaxID=1280672 RepID=UPI00041DD82C|nr:hypothetical protein [Butyrivibrio sp. AC2005]
MLKELDQGWNELIRKGRIHRGNRLLGQITRRKKEKLRAYNYKMIKNVKMALVYDCDLDKIVLAIFYITV